MKLILEHSPSERGMIRIKSGSPSEHLMEPKIGSMARDEFSRTSFFWLMELKISSMEIILADHTVFAWRFIHQTNTV